MHRCQGVLANEHDPQDQEAPQEEAQEPAGQDGLGPGIVGLAEQGTDDDNDRPREEEQERVNTRCSWMLVDGDPEG